MTNRWGNNANSDRFYSLGSNSLWTVTTTTKLKEAFPWKKSYDKPRQQIKKQKHYFATNVYIVKAMVFPVVLYGCESLQP